MKSQSLVNALFLLLWIVFVSVPAVVTLEHVSTDIDLTKCQNTESQSVRLACYKDLIKKTVSQNGVEYSLGVVRRILRDDSVDCHTLAHEMGRDFYLSIKKGGSPDIGDPMTDCGFGFWHGFMGEVARENEYEGESSIDLSSMCNKMLGDRKTLYTECFHGFGLGFLGDPPRQDYWGKPKDAVAYAVNECDQVTSDRVYQESCYSGVFHQLFIYMKRSEFSFKLPKQSELFGVCNTFDKKLINSCLSQLAPVLGYVMEPDINNFFRLLRTTYRTVTPQVRSQMARTMVGSLVNTSSDQKTREYLSDCFVLSGTEVEYCVKGVTGGAVTRTKGGVNEAINYMLNICEEAVPGIQNKGKCIQYVTEEKDALPL